MNKRTSSDGSFSRPALSVVKAIIAGWFFVNIPVLIIILGVLLVGTMIVPNVWQLFLLLGTFLGWMWWSYTIPRWRKWAIGRGAPADKLQKFAAITLLTWHKGSVFEKTETKIDE